MIPLGIHHIVKLLYHLETVAKLLNAFVKYWNAFVLNCPCDRHRRVDGAYPLFHHFHCYIFSYYNNEHVSGNHSMPDQTSVATLHWSHPSWLLDIDRFSWNIGLQVPS